jgi:hypothetical protein
VRPEKIVMLSEATEGVDCFPAQITEEIFRGPTTQFSLVTSDGLTLTALSASAGRSGSKQKTGDHVFFYIDPADVILLGNE